MSRLPRVAWIVMSGLLAAALARGGPRGESQLRAAELMVFGRLEVDAARVGSPPAETSFASTISHLQQRLQADQLAREAALRRAFHDVLGRAPAAEELSRPSGGPAYFEQVRRLLPAVPHEDVVSRAYRHALDREPYPEEREYWKKYAGVPFLVMSASLQNWARRNQPGLMSTAGRPTVSATSPEFASVVVAPSLAREIRELLHGKAENENDDRSASGRTLLYPGGEQILTDGPMHFVAAGRN